MTDSKDLFRFSGGQKLDLFLTREELSVSNSGFCEKNSTSLSFRVKCLMSFSIAGKLRYGVDVVGLGLAMKKKNYLLRNYSHFLQLGSEHLVYLAQL